MQPTPNPLMNLLPIAAIFAIFYFLVLRPQQQQQARHDKMVKDLKISDKILTSGGLYGTISGFKGDDLEVQFSQTVKLTVSRSAVTRVLTTDQMAKTPATV
jgi:preprotein translocase subunit YajC